ncbi:E3 SUMO-protein ligase ZBED1-like [Eucyclogobius newberryi]|uniref:E3 SUMO-protein ligase ZBED1-like n=1 Tax=Eucyclogobius newberryi TaxID=166745 RepID=UPI003B58EF19
MEGKSGPSGSGLNLVAHPRAKSKVWKYFGFDTDSDGCILHWKRIYCRVCMTQIAYSGNTSNLAYHLEKNHPVEYGELLKSNTDQMREAFVTAYTKIKTEPLILQVAQPYNPNMHQNLSNNCRHNDLSLAILNFICEGLYPVSIVEEPTFKSLMMTVDSSFTLPSKSDLALKMVPQMYCRIRNEVFSELTNVVYCGISTDLWQSLTQNRTYISLSIHAVNCNATGRFSMVNKCLKTFEVQEDNTAENITREMYETFVEWGITHKVSGATTSGSVDVVKACSLLEMSVEMPCFGHTLNRAMVESFQLPSVDSFLGCCRKLVDHFKEPVLYILREKQQMYGLPLATLISDKGGTWLATLAMLQMLKDQQMAINAVITHEDSGHPFNFTRTNWSLLEGLIDVLQPFKVVANMFTSCRFPTISMVKPVLHMLLNNNLKTKEGELKEVRLIKEIVTKVLTNTYSENSQQEIAMFLNIATFLDPRYKKLPFLSNKEHSKVESNLIDEAKAILEKQNACLEDFSFVSDEPPSKKQATSTHDNPLAAIFCQSESDQGQEELNSQVLEEIGNYKSQRVLGLNEDPLLWWSSHATLFPTLPKLLQKYWCVPATSAPCHRLFSSSGTVLCGKRNRITPLLVNQQVFLYENSRGYYEPEPCEEDLDVWEANSTLGQPL